MENNALQGAKEHFDFLIFVLSVFDRSLANVIALVAYSTNTNRSFSRMVGTMFVVYHSHRFNMAVKDLIFERKDMVEKIQAMMKKLSCSIATVLLRRLTPLSANCAWRSIYHML